MKKFLSIILFLHISTIFNASIDSNQMQKEKILIDDQNDEEDLQFKTFTEPTDDEIEAYDETISDHAKPPKLSSTLAFLQSIGIDILLCCINVKDFICHCTVQCKKNIMKLFGFNKIKKGKKVAL